MYRLRDGQFQFEYLSKIKYVAYKRDAGM